MFDDTRDRYLRNILVATGLVFILGIGTLMRVWPAGFAWTPGQGEYELMFVSVYATLGAFLLLASRDPDAYRSVILFAAWSSIVHGLVMAGQAVADPTERMHLVGDAPALLVIGAVLLAFAPERGSERSAPVERSLELEGVR